MELGSVSPFRCVAKSQQFRIIDSEGREQKRGCLFLLILGKKKQQAKIKSVCQSFSNVGIWQKNQNYLTELYRQNLVFVCYYCNQRHPLLMHCNSGNCFMQNLQKLANVIMSGWTRLNCVVFSLFICLSPSVWKSHNRDRESWWTPLYK